MSSTKLTGKVYHVGQTEFVSEKFSKRELVIETNDKYPQFISVQFVNDKCTVVDNIKLGEVVEVSVNIRGREWTDKNGTRKFFNTIEAWAISYAPIGYGSTPAQPMSQPTAPQAPQAPQQNTNDPLGLLSDNNNY